MINHTEKPSDILRPEGYLNNISSLLLSTFTINILSLALPIMTLQVYDRILPNQGTSTLSILIIGVCLAIFLEMVLRLCRAYVIGRSGATYEHLIACQAMNKVLHSDLSKAGHHGIGEHLHRMSAVGRLKDFYNGHAMTVWMELAFIPVFLGLVFYIATPLIIVPLVILAVFSILSLRQGYRLRQALKERESADDVRFNFLIESLEGVHTIKAFALEKFFERRYEALEEESTFKNYCVTEETSKIFNNGAIFSHIMVASVISFGAWCVLQGMVTTGGLIATLLLSGRMMQPVQKALGLWARYQDYILARQHLEDLMQTPQQNVLQRQDDTPLFPEGSVKIRDLDFCFSHTDENILSGINLNVVRGEAVLISGGHGSGKSTLLDILAGIYPPRRGHIDIDGVDVESYAPEELVRHIGFIRTRPLIFRGTIRDNMTSFGQIPESQAREVATYLGVDQDIAKLPSGLDTFLNGNHTDFIPPGLKQRIAMVRALAPKPKLILFDNADRSLDKEGYAMIYSFLARIKGKATLILVSDDKNICDLANTHYTLENGQLLPQTKQTKQGNITPYRELRL